MSTDLIRTPHFPGETDIMERVVVFQATKSAITPQAKGVHSKVLRAFIMALKMPWCPLINKCSFI